MKRFELAENIKILQAHTCEKCDFILYDAYECKENRCTIFCKDHLPQNKICEICEGEFLFNQNLTNKIKNRYQVKCLKCPSKMMLKDFDSHLKEGCKKECPQKCGNIFSREQELQTHLKEECVNNVITCMGYIGCKKKDARGMVLIHQEDCEDAQKIFELIDPLKQKLVFLANQNDSLKNLVSLLQQENQTLKNQLDQQNQRIFVLENQFQKTKEEERNPIKNSYPHFRNAQKKKYKKKHPNKRNQDPELSKFFNDLNNATEGNKKNIFGDFLYLKIEKHFMNHPSKYNDPGKITGMFLDSFYEHELLFIAEDNNELVSKIEEAIQLLQESFLEEREVQN